MGWVSSWFRFGVAAPTRPAHGRSALGLEGVSVAGLGWSKYVVVFPFLGRMAPSGQGDRRGVRPSSERLSDFSREGVLRMVRTLFTCHGPSQCR